MVNPAITHGVVVDVVLIVVELISKENPTTAFRMSDMDRLAMNMSR